MLQAFGTMKGLRNIQLCKLSNYGRGGTSEKDFRLTLFLSPQVTYPVTVSFEVTDVGVYTIKERDLGFRFTSNVSIAYDGLDIPGLPEVVVFDKAVGPEPITTIGVNGTGKLRPQM